MKPLNLDLRFVTEEVSSTLRVYFCALNEHLHPTAHIQSIN